MQTHIILFPARGETTRDCPWQAAVILSKSGLSKADVGLLWAMADADRDGKLCRHEFTVAMHLAACAGGKAGLPLPASLPTCLAAATATVAANASDQGGIDTEGEVEGRMMLIDDAQTVMSSLGYPEGLSDVDGSERGGVAGAGDNIPRNEKSQEMSWGTPIEFEESEAFAANAPNEKRDAPKVVDGVFGVEATTTKKGKTSGKREGGRSEGGGKAGIEKGKEADLCYSMISQDAVRYGKKFDKLVKSKGTKGLGGKEVRFGRCSCSSKS